MSMSDGWMPIETAPRDGVVLLSFIGHGENEAQNVAICYYDEDYGPCGYSEIAGGSGWVLSICGHPVEDQFLVNPTHWMPLPAPPSKK